MCERTAERAALGRAVSTSGTVFLAIAAATADGRPCAR
jgi:hypothetical protein